MCGRYASYLPAEAMRRTFRTVNRLPNLEPSWNVAPTQMAPEVRRHPETGERHLDLLQWGALSGLTDLRSKRYSNGYTEQHECVVCYRPAGPLCWRYERSHRP